MINKELLIVYPLGLALSGFGGDLLRQTWPNTWAAPVIALSHFVASHQFDRPSAPMSKKAFTVAIATTIVSFLATGVSIAQIVRTFKQPLSWKQRLLRVSLHVCSIRYTIKRMFEPS